MALPTRLTLMDCEEEGFPPALVIVEATPQFWAAISVVVAVLAAVGAWLKSPAFLATREDPTPASSGGPLSRRPAQSVGIERGRAAPSLLKAAARQRRTGRASGAIPSDGSPQSPHTTPGTRSARGFPFCRPETDAYLCPEGETLSYKDSFIHENGYALWRYQAPAAACRACPAFGRCTTSGRGRTIRVSEYEPLLCCAVAPDVHRLVLCLEKLAHGR